MYYKQTKEGFASKQLFVLFPQFNSFFSRFSSSDYWFNQMYYGTHGPFKRAEGGQAITFENDKVLFSSHSITYDLEIAFLLPRSKFTHIWYEDEY